MKKDKETVKEVVTPEVAAKEDLERRGKMFQVDLEISSKKYQVMLVALIAPQGPILQIVDQKNVKK